MHVNVVLHVFVVMQTSLVFHRPLVKTMLHYQRGPLNCVIENSMHQAEVLWHAEGQKGATHMRLDGEPWAQPVPAKGAPEGPLRVSICNDIACQGSCQSPSSYACKQGMLSTKIRQWVLGCQTVCVSCKCAQHCQQEDRFACAKAEAKHALQLQLCPRQYESCGTMWRHLFVCNM